MTDPAPTSAGSDDATASRGRRTVSELPRRTIVLSAVVLFGAILLGVGAIALFADPGPPTAPNDGPPRIIEQPNSGKAPEAPGDRGGWEQLALLGLIVVAVGGIGLVVFRGSSSARANRQAWRDAADAGHDGALGSPR